MRRLTCWIVALWCGVSLAEFDASDYAAPATPPATALTTQRSDDRDLPLNDTVAATQIQEEALARLMGTSGRFTPQTAEEALLHSRCYRCHTAEQLKRVTHSLAGWWWVVARMRWLNGAEVTWREMVTLTDYLAQKQPAHRPVALFEWLTSLLVLFALLLLTARLLHRRIRKGTRER